MSSTNPVLIYKIVGIFVSEAHATKKGNYNNKFEKSHSFVLILRLVISMYFFIRNLF